MKIDLKYTLSFAVLFISHLIMAQPPAPPATPIDGGLSILLGAAGVLGLRKIMKSKKTS